MMLYKFDYYYYYYYTQTRKQSTNEPASVCGGNTGPMKPTSVLQVIDRSTNQRLFATSRREDDKTRLQRAV